MPTLIVKLYIYKSKKTITIKVKVIVMYWEKKKEHDKKLLGCGHVLIFNLGDDYRSGHLLTINIHPSSKLCFLQCFTCAILHNKIMFKSE